jgi:hypothetical protein
MTHPRIIGIMLATLFSLACASSLWAQSPYRWSLIRQGGKLEANTYVTGMNDAQWFVGQYEWLDGSDSGSFRFSKNKFYEFAVPGADVTWAEDIGSSSTIVGTYYTEADGVYRAFMYRHGLNAYVDISYPGAFWSFGLAVNNKNHAAIGYYKEDPELGVVWGGAIYDYNKKTYTDVTGFDGGPVHILGINDALDMVASGGEDCTCSRFVRWKGVDYLMDVGGPPGNENLVYPNRINNNGDVVGNFIAEAGAGFKMSMKSGVWEIITHPQNTLAKGWWMNITGIANNGQMAAILIREPTSENEGYTESWWLRPTQPAKVAKR